MLHLHLHLVSDSTGDTVHSMARAAISQFEGVKFSEYNWPLIRTPEQIDGILDAVKNNSGIVIYTLVDDSLRLSLEQRCIQANIPHLSVLDPIMAFLGNYLGVKSANRPGRQHAMDKEYFARIEAMHYAISHDDGQGLWDLHEADVVIIGVSRTSKTPTCIYLANRGLKAANIPFVPNVEFPKELQQFNNKSATTGPKKPLVVGLTKDPKSLVQIRKNRLRMIAKQQETNYTDIEIVKKELANCRKLCSKNGWPVIDVSRRSIEESGCNHFAL